MTGKVKLTVEQAEAIEVVRTIIIPIEFADKLKGLSAADILQAIKEGYDVEPQFKGGDWIVVEDCPCERIIGKVQQIKDIYKIGNSLRYEYEEWWSIKNKTSLRHATSDEIKAEKERRLWNSISREVGELKENDLVIYENKYFRLFKNMGCEIYGFHMDPVYASKLYGNGNIKGFYPAESFISFESEGES